MKSKPAQYFTAVFYGSGRLGPTTHYRVAAAPSKAEFTRQAKATAAQENWRLVEIYPSRPDDVNCDFGQDE